MISLFVDFLYMLLVYDLLVITKQQFDEKYLKTLVVPPLVYCGTVLLFHSKENIFQESLFDHKLLRGWDGMGDSGDNWITHVYKRRISIMYSPSRVEIDLEV